MRFFTICAANFLSYAIVLSENLRKYHPSSSFDVFLADRIKGFDPETLPFNITSLDDIGIPDIQNMVKRYNITELCTSIKPFCFLKLFLEAPETPVVYLDPDIYVVSRMAEIEEAFDGGSEAVMTPHILNPAEFAEFPDVQHLKLGVYNFGFFAARQTTRTERILRWWARRLEEDCVIDVPNGLFVDQKWADLFPCFIDGIKILRNPGYNVAYWNLHERDITINAENNWNSNGVPLRFAHFSGADMSDGVMVSRHSGRFRIDNSRGFGILLQEFRDRVRAARYDEFQKLPFSFFWDRADKSNEHAPHRGDVENRTIWKDPATFLFSKQIFSHDRYIGFLSAQRRKHEFQRQLEEGLIDHQGSHFKSAGHCYTCALKVEFITSFMYAYERASDGSLIPNWREHVACPNCGLPNRVRACMHLFCTEFEPKSDAAIYITEQTTKLYKWMKPRFLRLVGSEYLGGAAMPGALIDGIRNENLENLSFPDCAFEYVLSFDVLEHVVDHISALREIFRCLRPGGYLIFSVPANMTKVDNVTRAFANADGSITHILEPEYHGNPVDPEGKALCYRYFGWELIQQMKEIGYQNPFIFHYWSDQFGYLGAEQIIFVAQRPSR